MNTRPMNHDVDLAPELQHLAMSIQKLAEKSRGDTLGLLALLRVLERSHREICEGPFQESLPNNRQALYALLKDIEANGGWPYIYRMRLEAFLRNLEPISEMNEGNSVDPE